MASSPPKRRHRNEAEDQGFSQWVKSSSNSKAPASPRTLASPRKQVRRGVGPPPRLAMLDNQEVPASSIAALAKLPANQICFDCGRDDDIVAVSSNLGIFLCSECATLHRALGQSTSVIKFFEGSRDKFDGNELAILTELGNERGRDYYLYQIPSYVPIPERREFGRSKAVLQEWINCKYVEKFFYPPNVQGTHAYSVYKQTGKLSKILWLHILSYLSGEDLARLSMVSKEFENLTRYLWRFAFLRDWDLRYPYRSTYSYEWKEWRSMYSKVFRTVDVVKAGNASKAVVDIEIPVYMNEEKSVMMDLVQNRKYINISSHSMTVKLLINVINLNDIQKGLLAVNGFIYLIDMRTIKRDDLQRIVSSYKRLGFACPTVLVGFVDKKSEQDLSCDYVQSFIANNGFEAYIPVGELADSNFMVFSKHQHGLETMKKAVSPRLALKLATEVLVEKLCVVGWPGITIPPKMIPDSFSGECQICTSKFSAMKRRHHCRRCGALCCGKCAKNKMLIPHIKQLTGVALLVCVKCEEILTHMKESERKHA